METSIIKIGNSKGLFLSKVILKKYNIEDKVELILEKRQIILKPVSSKENRENEFRKMNENGDDKLLINDILEDENFEEWI